MTHTLLTLTVTLCLIGPAVADKTGADTSSDASQTLGLRTQVQALELMNHTLGGKAPKAEARVAMMRQYLEKNDLLTAYNASISDEQSPLKQLSFDDALHTAIEHVQSSGEPLDKATANQPVDQLEREVKGLESLARPRFEQVRQSRAEANQIAAFLKAQGKLGDYMAWSEGEAAKQKSAAEQAAAEAAAKDNAQAEAAHDRAMKLEQQARERQHEEHQQRLKQQFELQEQAMQDETAVRVAGQHPYAGEYNWGAWDDPYHDVYVSRGRRVR